MNDTKLKLDSIFDSIYNSIAHSV